MNRDYLLVVGFVAFSLWLATNAIIAIKTIRRARTVQTLRMEARLASALDGADGLAEAIARIVEADGGIITAWATTMICSVVREYVRVRIACARQED